MSKRRLERELKEYTPEIMVVAGDKIVIDRVETLQLDAPFKHQHDAEVRLPFSGSFVPTDEQRD